MEGAGAKLTRLGLPNPKPLHAFDPFDAIFIGQFPHLVECIDAAMAAEIMHRYTRIELVGAERVLPREDLQIGLITAKHHRNMPPAQ